MTRDRCSCALFAIALCTSCNYFGETRRCHNLMTTAQETVNKVDGKSPASVKDSIAAVETARAVCEKAGRTTERDELQQAENQLQAHADYLARKGTEPPPKKRSSAEWKELEQHGDPNCPKGQAYRSDAQREVRCTGPELVDMSWPSARAYFDGRGYKITTTDSPATLKAEYGAELYLYQYASPNDANPPRCVTFYPPPGMSGLEGAGRVTGVPLKRLRDATSVSTPRGDLALRIDESESKVVVRVGECGG